MVKLKCDVNNFALSSEKGKWERGKMSWELVVDLLRKNLIKKNFFDVGDETYSFKDNFKILSVSKNGLVAISEELTSQYTGAPSVATITLDNLVSQSNSSVGVTYTFHQQLNSEDVFIVQYGKCK